MFTNGLYPSKALLFNEVGAATADKVPNGTEGGAVPHVVRILHRALHTIQMEAAPEMLKKRRFAKDNVVKVTFSLDSDIARESVRVVGEFNQWEGTPLERHKDGSWRATVSLEPGREYEFRYLVDGKRWVNEPMADRYARNPYGEDNSVIKT